MTSDTLTRNRNWVYAVALVACTGLSLGARALPVAVATYDFDDGTLNANETGVTSLTAIDPLGTNGFITDTVFGDTKTVYRFDGTAGTPGIEQAGVALNTTGLLSGSAYSVDIVFSFDADGATWERILDASNRTSDDGFYVEPGHRLQVFPVADGPDSWTFGEYHRVTLTNNGLGHVIAYLDGAFQFDLLTGVMDFSTYAVANPSNILTFFADNELGGPAPEEFVDGKVSLIRLYDFELDSGDVGDIGNGNGVPEPATLALVGVGFAGLAARRRKAAKR